VCYVDTTVALPILTAYAMANREPRPLKRLYERLDDLLAELKRSYRGTPPKD